MLPLISTTHTAHACCVLVLLMLSQTVRSRPMKDEKLEKLLLDVIKERLVAKQIDGNKFNLNEDHIQNLQPDFTNMPSVPSKEENSKQRIKRVGIAGNENIDLILSTLGRQGSSGANGRFRSPLRTNSGFRPSLSVSGSLADLRSMMQKAG